MPDLGHDKENQADTGSGAAPQSRISRRQVMTASAVVAGVGLASVPARAEADTGGQAVSLGEPGTTTVEFRGRVIQSGSSGQTFTSFGYLIRASHANQDDLFHGTPISEQTALLTVFAPDTGLPTLTGDMLQTAAHALSGPLAGQTFGRRGTRMRFFATGLGQ